MLVQLNQDEMILRGNFVENFLEGYRSEHTKRTYEGAIKDFFGVDDVRFVNLSMVRNVGIVKIQGWIKSCLDRGNSIKTVEKNLYGLAGLVDRIISLSKGKEIGYNIFKDNEVKKLLRLNREIRDYEIGILSDEEVKKLLGIKKGFYDQLLLKCLLNWGVRRSEIVGVKWNDFFEDGDWYVKIRGKGNKERIIYVNDEILGMLRELEWKFGKLGEGNRRLFDFSDTTVNNKVKKYCKMIGREDLTAHCMRHTSITSLIDNGVKEGIVQEYAGHSDYRTTRKYYHLRDKKVNNGGRFVRF